MDQTYFSYALPELEVTSGKKYQAEMAQVTPKSISVFQGETIEQRFSTDLTDIGQWAPNVNFRDLRTRPNAAAFDIRGMGSDSSGLSIEPAVGIFVDGMYMGVTQGAVLDTFDFESIEILRGPQGTLFGRNVTGGAVVVRHRQPTGELGLRGRTQLVDNNGGLWLQQNIVAEAPLHDTLAAKLAVLYRDDEGHFKNLSIPGERTGGGATYLIRPQLRWQPNTDIDVSVISEYQKFDGDGVYFALVEDRTTFTEPPANDDEVFQDFPGFAEYEIGSVVAEVNWLIGPGKLTSISGWRDYKASVTTDFDGTRTSDYTSHAISPDLRQEQFSQEFRYALPISERLDVTTGLFFFTQDAQFTDIRFFNDSTTPSTQANGFQDHIAAAVFTQGSYLLTQDLTFSLGARYSWEEKEVRVASRSSSCLPPTPAVSCPATFRDKNDWAFLSGGAGLDWQVNNDMLLYGNWDISYRSGGYNIRSVEGVSSGPFDEEKVNAFEIGLKADWLNGRLRTNLAAFHNKFDNLQRQLLVARGIGGFGVEINNAADATIVGLELEVNALPTERFQLDFSVGFAEGHYDEFLLDLDLDGIPDSELAKELDFPNPKWTAYIGGRYELPWQPSIGGHFILQSSASYVDERPSPNSARDEIITDGFTLVDAALIYELPVSGLTASVFGRNLLDDIYTTETVALGPASIADFSRAPGRRIGVEFSYEF